MCTLRKSAKFKGNPFDSSVKSYTIAIESHIFVTFTRIFHAKVTKTRLKVTFCHPKSLNL
ncbi:Uncharacterised protein [Rothia aeria]|uniref:Uncharacterized protein n=1 Tax=Rothia aeria TaxID=172042 RepID=A0A7Z9A7N0_9MICC|nr:Uncharacterised protein [Rothia aeria]